MSLSIAAPSLLLTLALLAGCTASPSKPLAEQEPRPLLGDPELPYLPEQDPVVGDILHLPTGLYVDQQQMLDAVVDNRMIYIGETHDNPAAHRFQLMVLKEMAARYPGEMALGLEMMVPAQQAVLDQWLAGELDEPGFLREANWYGVWSADFAHYREIFEFARDNDIAIRGLNAETKLVRAIGEKPDEELY